MQVKMMEQIDFTSDDPDEQKGMQFDHDAALLQGNPNLPAVAAAKRKLDPELENSNGYKTY